MQSLWCGAQGLPWICDWSVGLPSGLSGHFVSVSSGTRPQLSGGWLIHSVFTVVQSGPIPLLGTQGSMTHRPWGVQGAPR